MCATCRQCKKAGRPTCQPLDIQLMRTGPSGLGAGLLKILLPSPCTFPADSAFLPRLSQGCAVPSSCSASACAVLLASSSPPPDTAQRADPRCASTGSSSTEYDNDLVGLYSLHHTRHKRWSINHLPSCDDVLPMGQLPQRLSSKRAQLHRHKQARRYSVAGGPKWSMDGAACALPA